MKVNIDTMAIGLISLDNFEHAFYIIHFERRQRNQSYKSKHQVICTVEHTQSTYFEKKNFLTIFLTLLKIIIFCLG